MANVTKTEVAGGATLAGAVGTAANLTGSGSAIASTIASLAETLYGVSSGAKLGAFIASTVSSLGVAAPVILVVGGIITVIVANEEFNK